MPTATLGLPCIYKSADQPPGVFVPNVPIPSKRLDAVHDLVERRQGAKIRRKRIFGQGDTGPTLAGDVRLKARIPLEFTLRQPPCLMKPGLPGGVRKQATGRTCSQAAAATNTPMLQRKTKSICTATTAQVWSQGQNDSDVILAVSF